MLLRRKGIIVCVILLLLGFAFRFCLAHFLSNDEPTDGKVYAQMARNLLEQHVYSHATEAPYEPSLIRLPGYPLFLAAIYSGFGHSNNSAVRIVQAVSDTAACGLAGIVAFLWEPDEERKQTAALWALGLAAFCPFTAIYVATILTETLTIFLAMAMCLTATLAFQANTFRRSLIFWFLTGIVAAIAVLFRPDSGLFAASIGITLVIRTLLELWKGRNKSSRSDVKRRITFATFSAAVFSVSFCLVLVPWTIRNYRVFHLFQPLAPAHAEMPGEFVPRGYLTWVRTWLDDGRYVGPALWSMDERALKISDFPDRAFDSPVEKEAVAALLERYNHPPDSADESQSGNESTGPKTSTSDEAQQDSAADSSDEESDAAEEDEKSPDDQSTAAEEQDVEMTPEVDAGFAELARTRIARAPFRYYIRLPLRRAVSLWFDTHSQYYPFQGELLPLSDLDHDIRQHFWLPFFTGLTCLYTLLGIAGAWCLWRARSLTARSWLILALLMTLTRLAFFSSLENPEPRYVVEIFPFLAILGGIAVAQIDVRTLWPFLRQKLQT
jgi:signal transduction histidine kinase